MEDEITKQIEEFLGFEPPRIPGPHLAISIFVREQIGSIITADVTKDNEKYSSPVGRVVSVGLECYPKDRFPSGTRCKLGDWVCFKPNYGQLLNYRGNIMNFMYDDGVLFPVEDPTYVTRC